MKEIIIGALLIATLSCAIIVIMKPENTHKSDYQIEVSLKGTTIYDGNRKVGFLPHSNSQLDSLIINDNL